jgi:ribosome-binding protein aMBF1 (putative translation factor)
MTLGIAQCRGARAMLGWSTNDLATAANVGLATVRRFETGATIQERPLQAMREALEAAGIRFISDGEASPLGGPGVRLKENL